MIKRFFIAILAAAALLAVSCDPKEDNPGGDGSFTKDDIVGSWLQPGSDTPSFVFKKDGSYTETRWEETITGKWAYSDGVLSFTPQGEDPWDAKLLMVGGKAWMVLVYENGEGENKFRSYENYLKSGATINSGKLTDGRWDATNSGYKPAAYTKDVDYISCMVVKGNTVDVYIPMWGTHVQGTFTLSNGKMHIETDGDHIWKAVWVNWDGSSDSGSIGWNAWDCPSVDYESTWDDSYGAMDPETFKVQSPYEWYTVNQIMAMGAEPKPGDPVYERDKYMFKYMVYEFGANEYEIGLDLCDFYLCMDPNGTEAYGGVVGRASWMYKR